MLILLGGPECLLVLLCKKGKTTRLCTVKITFNWVKGYVYLSNRPLSRDKRLNMVVDLQADKTRSDARGATAARSAYVHWDIKVAPLSLRGGKLTSQYKEQLQTQLHDKAIKAFINKKESWSQHTFSTVNWSACGTVFKRLSKNRKINASKACFNYWHTGAKHATFYQ
jgi:hypothetical protein